MERREFVLAVLSTAKGEEFRPVQVQKLFFLIDQEIKELVGGKQFDFVPHSYGPFDKDVYKELEALAGAGEVEISPEMTWRTYRLTTVGQARGQSLLERLPNGARDYIIKASNFVRSLPFASLVAAIYKAYPEMRKNSVFQD